MDVLILTDLRGGVWYVVSVLYIVARPLPASVLSPFPFRSSSHSSRIQVSPSFGLMTLPLGSIALMPTSLFVPTC